MNVYVATAGEEPYHQAQADIFRELVDLDSLGEHRLTSDPAQAGALLFVDLHQHPNDPYLRILRNHELVRRWKQKVFVYDQRDQPFFTFPGVYVGGGLGLARRRPVVGGPYVENPTRLYPGAMMTDLLFSFQGSRTHPCREAVLALRHDLAIIEDTSSIDFFTDDHPQQRVRREQARSRYQSVVARSKFVLCPRGHGPSSFRLYEAMSAERVPVVISDRWLPPPRVDWSRCAVRVAERDVAHLPRLLERLEPQWEDMVAAGRDVLAQELGVARRWHHYVTSVRKLQGRPGQRRGAWWTDPQVSRIVARRLRSTYIR